MWPGRFFQRHIPGPILIINHPGLIQTHNTRKNSSKSVNLFLSIALSNIFRHLFVCVDSVHGNINIEKEEQIAGGYAMWPAYVVSPFSRGSEARPRVTRSDAAPAHFVYVQSTASLLLITVKVVNRIF